MCGMNARQSHASIILIEIKAGLRLTNLESRVPKKTLRAFQINLSLSPPLSFWLKCPSLCSAPAR